MKASTPIAMKKNLKGKLKSLEYQLKITTKFGDKSRIESEIVKCKEALRAVTAQVITYGKEKRAYNHNCLETEDDLLMTRITQARFDLYRAMLRFSGEGRQDFRDIINSLLSVLQLPMVFVIFYFDSKYNRWDKLFSFQRDFYYSDELQNAIDRLYEGPNIIERHLFRLGVFNYNGKKTKFAIIGFRVITDPIVTHDDELIEFSPIERFEGHSINNLNNVKNISSTDDYIMLMMHLFFERSWHFGFMKEMFDSYVEKAIANLQRRYNEYIEFKSKIGLSSGIIFSNSAEEISIWGSKKESTELALRHLRDEWRARVEKALDINFVGISNKTRILNNSYGETGVRNYNIPSVPNVLFAIRTFTRTSLRVQKETLNEFQRGYDYDIGFIICETQKQIIENFFNWLKINSHRFQTGDLSRFSYQRTLSDQYKDIGLDIDKYFWQEIINRDGGSKLAVEILQSWIGIGTRSFTDPVFSNGTIHIRYPFEHGGLKRVPSTRTANKFIDLDEVDKNDVLRIVIAHYLFIGMAPNIGVSSEGRLGLVLVPIQVNGSVYAVTCHAVWYPAINQAFSRRDIWRGTYLLCTDIKSAASRVLRNAIYNVHINVCETMAIRELFSRAKGDDTDRYNEEVDWLRYVSPYAIPWMTTEPLEGNEPFRAIQKFYNNKWTEVRMNLSRQTAYPLVKLFSQPTLAEVKSSMDKAFGPVERLLRSEKEQDIAHFMTRAGVS